MTSQNRLLGGARKIQAGLGAWLLGVWCAALANLACEGSGKASAVHARAHVEQLATMVQRDVEQVRQGLPQGAVQLVELWKGDTPEVDRQQARKWLARVRDDVFELSIAKSTFFAVTDRDGLILRSDQEVDALAEKNLWTAFPALQSARERYTEAVGQMPEALGVKGKPDGQWVAATPIVLEGEPRGLYVTGWSWVKYCYSLEDSLRGSVRSALLDDEGNIDKEPLLYVFLLLGQEVYGAPAAPQYNADKIAELGLPSKLEGTDVYSQPLEIDGRSFGLGARRVPVLREDAAVVVLRSET